MHFVRYCSKRKLNEKWLEAKVNLVQINNKKFKKKLDILVISSLRSTSTRLSPKDFEKGRALVQLYNDNNNNCS